MFSPTISYKYGCLCHTLQFDRVAIKILHKLDKDRL